MRLVGLCLFNLTTSDKVACVYRGPVYDLCIEQKYGINFTRCLIWERRMLWPKYQPGTNPSLWTTSIKYGGLEVCGEKNKTYVTCMCYTPPITCVCQSTWKPSQWSTVTPRSYWSSRTARGGTRASAACDWTRGPCITRVQEACFKFPSWTWRLRSIFCVFSVWDRLRGFEAKQRTTVRTTCI